MLSLVYVLVKIGYVNENRSTVQFEDDIDCIQMLKFNLTNEYPFGWTEHVVQMELMTSQNDSVQRSNQNPMFSL